MKEKFFYQRISAFGGLSLPGSSFSFVSDLVSSVHTNHQNEWLICSAEA
jgi:hypothetical protein